MNECFAVLVLAGEWLVPEAVEAAQKAAGFAASPGGLLSDRPVWLPPCGVASEEQLHKLVFKLSFFTDVACKSIEVRGRYSPDWRVASVVYGENKSRMIEALRSISAVQLRKPPE